jgi:hypothetical protein
MTDALVHFIHGRDPAHAFGTLRRILEERQLRCGTGYIKGNHCCVCFSEAPLPYLGRALLEGYSAESPYHPFGILAKKVWLYRQGGRPVIYQPDGEYEALPEDLRWRHVRFELLANEGLLQSGPRGALFSLARRVCK